MLLSGAVNAVKGPIPGFPAPTLPKVGTSAVDPHLPPLRISHISYRVVLQIRVPSRGEAYYSGLKSHTVLKLHQLKSPKSPDIVAIYHARVFGWKGGSRNRLAINTSCQPHSASGVEPALVDITAVIGALAALAAGLASVSAASAPPVNLDRLDGNGAAGLALCRRQEGERKWRQ